MDFADVVKDFETERLSWILMVDPKYNHKEIEEEIDVYKKEIDVWHKEENVMWLEAESDMMHFGGVGRGHNLRKTKLLEAKKGKE